MNRNHLNDQQNNNDGRDTFFDVPPQPAGQNYCPPPPPAPQKRTFMTTWFPIILAVFMLVFGFFGGMLVGNFTRPEEGKVIDWMIETVKKYSIYYDGKSEEEMQNILATMGRYGVYYLTDGDGDGDQYSDFLSPSEYQELLREMQGNSGGLAVEYWQDYDSEGNPLSKTKNVFLSQVYNCKTETKYSASNQLRQFDRFYSLEVGGKFVSYWEMSFGSLVSAMNQNGMDKTFRAQVIRVEEKPDGTCDYPKLSDGKTIDTSNPVTVELKLEDYEPNYVEYYGSDTVVPMLGNTQGEKQNFTPMAGTGLDEDTAYISFKSFMGGTDDDNVRRGAGVQFEAAMNRFKSENKRNLILDLRYDGGGLLSILGEMASYLVKNPENSKKTVLGYEDYKDKSNNASFTTADNLYGDMKFDKIVVLTNKNTASASEALIGAMDFYGTLSALVGADSYGKGIMQTYFYYNQLGGPRYALKLTVAQLTQPDGKTIHKTGFRFDDPNTAANEKNFRADGISAKETLYSPTDYSSDAQLRAAIEYLKG